MGGQPAKLSDDQRREFGQYCDRHHGRDPTIPTPLHLALVLAGDKPATCINPRPWEFPDDALVEEQARTFIERLNLHYRAWNQSGWIVSRTRGRLDLLPTTIGVPSDAAYDRRLGVVFGYPMDAIEFFVTTDLSERVSPRERVESGEFTPEEIAYAELLPYKHDTSIEGYERAITNGEALRERFSELADEWELPHLDEIAKAYYQQVLSKYSDSGGETQGPMVDLGGFTVPNPPRLD